MNQGVVGIVGVGNMGGAMAARLLDAGWRVQVHDINRGKVDALQAAGAIAASNSAEAAAGAACFIVCVVDAAQAESVLFGADGAAAALRVGSRCCCAPPLLPRTPSVWPLR